MKYSRFEELPVWNSAIDLALRIYNLTQDKVCAGRGSLKDQLDRAAVSVSNNIAEGFERGTTQELLSFLYIARGSAGEVRSMLTLIDKIESFSNLKSQIPDLRSLSESISRQLRAWADKVQNMPIDGQRYLTDKVRQSEKMRRDRDEFLAELKQSQAASRKVE